VAASEVALPKRTRREPIREEPMKLNRLLTSALLTAALLLPASLVSAANAEGFVKEKHSELVSLVKKAKSSADDKKVEAAFDEVLDYDTLAKESLKEYWAERTPEERAEFQAVLTKLVRGAYRKSLKRIAGYEVEYKGAQKQDGGELVRTIARKKGDAREEPLSIDYVVNDASGKNKIVDIVTEGSSLVVNYRNQFRRIIKKQGFPDLLKRMKVKLDKGDVN
jgi:phospholipid transport system substrate-binding protein